MQATILLLVVMFAGCGDQGTVYIFHGPLRSTSVPAATINPGRYELSVVATGDINGDGRPDFAVVSDEATDLYFGMHDDADASSSEHSGLVPLGDVNADGRADFLLGAPGDEVFSFYPGGARPFDSGTALPDTIYAATTADMDGDGIADLVVASYDNVRKPPQCNVSVHHGGASFDVAATSTHVISEQADDAWEPSLRSAGDIDGDGREDLVLGCGNPGKLAVYFGGGSPSTPSRTIAMGHFPVIARDFDGDGFGDLAATNGDPDQQDPEVLVYFGPELDTPRLQIPGTIADAGDVDGDGHPDLVVIEPSGNVGVYLGGPAMDVTLDIDLAPPDGQYFDSAAFLGDIDGDGNADLAAGYGGWRSE